MTTRTTDTALDPIFLARWSPRAFDGSDVSAADLETILEAARWAPSSMNHQPWRFLYALRGDAEWEAFLAPLMPFNRDWAQHSAALIYIASDKMLGDKPSYTHSFDAGAAWGMMALQAQMLGYHSHGMAGVDFPAAAQSLGVPDDFKLEVGIALGRIGDPATLPEKLRARESPSGRKPLAEIAWRGRFGG
jgi:nitroreductase